MLVAAAPPFPTPGGVVGGALPGASELDEVALGFVAGGVAGGGTASGPRATGALGATVGSGAGRGSAGLG
jgi:hypothetical protein